MPPPVGAECHPSAWNTLLPIAQEGHSANPEQRLLSLRCVERLPNWISIKQGADGGPRAGVVARRTAALLHLRPGRPPFHLDARSNRTRDVRMARSCPAR